MVKMTCGPTWVQRGREGGGEGRGPIPGGALSYVMTNS